ncbi:MAG: 3-methyl-2-oxobutanoate hydroxymethyltransferase [Proteobacteria bacterium]|nr:3-methyl-2-oxobutanoate hydroxymethyltransferase [Pseudomonadota bacterium]
MKETKENPSKLVCVTAYDYTFAKLLDESGVDIILVGDSLGMVVQGNSNTLSVTLEQMIYHTQCVSRGVQEAHLCVDMPFMSYQVSAREALRNAGRLVSEGGAHSVKLEGGVNIARTVEKITSSGIPVLGHVGLTPQSFHQLGGYKIQGKTVSARESLLQDALALEDSGAYALVLEGIPAELAKAITDRLKIPTIGIGAGPHCDGQVLVLQDILGLNTDFKPKFVKAYGNLNELVKEAITQFSNEVKSSKFPTKEHSFYAGS